jgi:hypothetical protein
LGLNRRFNSLFCALIFVFLRSLFELIFVKVLVTYLFFGFIRKHSVCSVSQVTCYVVLLISVCKLCWIFAWWFMPNAKSFCWFIIFDRIMQRLELVRPLRKTIWDISMWWSLAQLSLLMKVLMALTTWFYTYKCIIFFFIFAWNWEEN